MAENGTGSCGQKSFNRKGRSRPLQLVNRRLWLALLALAACSSSAAPPRDRDDASATEEPPASDGAATPARDSARAADLAPPAPAADAAPGLPLPDGAAPVSADAMVPAGDIVAPKTVVLDGEKLADARRRLATDATLKATLARLTALADAALTAGPWSVMDKTANPPSGNKHDYYSLARYYWPSPSANGCPYIHKDGETNPETSGPKYDHASRHAAMDALFDLAMAWYFTGDARYGQRAGLVARTWFLDPATAMNPNVSFGEGVPCLRNGTDTGVLNWTELLGQTLDAVAVLDTGAPGWTMADQQGMRTWMTAMLNWLQTSALGKEEGTAVNNHGTWYDAGVVSVMVYLGQTAPARTLLMGSGMKRIATQVKADGSQPEELARTNTWGYSNWNVEGLCLMAHTASRVGVDLWGYTAPGGGSIVKAIDFLIDGATKGKSAWTHPQIIAFEPSWALSALHAAADFGNDARARAALPMVPAPPSGDLWPLLPACVAAAIQPQ
jgi:hypothetical protein